MPKNKVKYDLRNVHCASITETEGKLTFGTPKAVPGAVNLSLSAQGEHGEFYADGILYYDQYVNNGYEGTLEMALIPDWFREDFLGETTDTSGVTTENTYAAQKHFAILFEFVGDVKGIRHVMYYCLAARPDISGKTKEKTLAVQTDTLSITASPRPDTGDVKSKTNEETTKTVYDNWYKQVYTPPPADPEGEG